jgi:hypothetical protein
MTPGADWGVELLDIIALSPQPPQGRQQAQEDEEHGQEGGDHCKASVTGAGGLLEACNE